MKKIVLLLLATILMSATAKNAEPNFVGKWTGDDNKEVGFITFDKEGYASFEVKGQVLGGKEFEMNGQKGKMTYEINTKTNPIQVDFIITKLDTGEEKRMLCIAEFIDKNTMNFALNFDNIRPKDFQSKNAIVLTREK
jgi:hypothetical protein